jgi:hypothetical protein
VFQPRALGRKVSDEFTVPLCRVHHRELHGVGGEAEWWEKVKIDPLDDAQGLWQRTNLVCHDDRAVVREGHGSVAGGPPSGENHDIASQAACARCRSDGPQQLGGEVEALNTHHDALPYPLFRAANPKNGKSL